MPTEQEVDDVIDDAVEELRDDDTRAFLVTTMKSDGTTTTNWYGNGRVGKYPDLIALQSNAALNYSAFAGEPLKRVYVEMINASEVFKSGFEADPELISDKPR